MFDWKFVPSTDGVKRSLLNAERSKEFRRTSRGFQKALDEADRLMGQVARQQRELEEDDGSSEPSDRVEEVRSAAAESKPRYSPGCAVRYVDPTKSAFLEHAGKFIRGDAVQSQIVAEDGQTRWVPTHCLRGCA
jgi:hypothetical protein